MADRATAAFDSGRSLGADPDPLGEPVDFDVRGLGRRLPRTEAPEGWIKKIERRREGKVWVGFFHLWTTDANGPPEKGKDARACFDAETRGAAEVGRLH